MVKNRVAYSIETKNKAVEMKLQGYSTKQVMLELNIKNKTQVETWFKWYKNGETYRFHQPVGKQYSYNKAISELSEIDQLKLELRRKEVELEILKNTRNWKGKKNPTKIGLPVSGIQPETGSPRVFLLNSHFLGSVPLFLEGCFIFLYQVVV